MNLFSFKITKELTDFLVINDCDCFLIADWDIAVPLILKGSLVFLKRIPKDHFWKIAQGYRKYMVEYEHGLIAFYRGLRTDNVIRFFDIATGLSSEGLPFEIKALFEILAVER